MPRNIPPQWVDKSHWLHLLDPRVTDGLITYCGKRFIEDGLIAVADRHEFLGQFYSTRCGQCTAGFAAANAV